jgi:polysaccharide chain length determinant protein (PEP-CTERM system associated)
MGQVFEEFRAALWSVWNRRWLALAVAWGVCLAGWLAVAFFPNTYESQTRLFVQLDDVLADQIGIGAGSREKGLERVRQTLASAVNMEKVVRSTRIGKGVTTPAQMQAEIATLIKSVKVVGEGDKKDVFTITARSGRSDLSDGENAQLAQDIAQRMIDIFREENLGGTRGEMRETIDFLDQQLAQRQKQLEDAEQRRLTFEASHPELVGGTQTIMTQMAQSRAELRSVEADLAAAQSALAALDGQIAGTPRSLTVAGDGGPRAALAQAEANLSAMQARGLTDGHPDVIAAKKQIASLRQQAAGPNGAAGGTPNPAYSSLQAMRVERAANVQSLQSRAVALRSEIASIEANQQQEPGAAAEAQRISRDYEVLRQQYDKLLQDREELRLRGQVETERSAIKFEVVDPPTLPRAPAAPNRPLLLFGVLFLGVAAGAGAAWGKGQLQSSFATATKLEKTFDLPVIGTISHSLTEAARTLQRKRFKQFAMGVGGLGLLFVALMAAEFVQRGMVA